MSSYKKLEVKRFPRVSQQDNKEAKFWDKFKVSSQLKVHTITPNITCLASRHS